MIQWFKKVRDSHFQYTILVERKPAVFKSVLQNSGAVQRPRTQDVSTSISTKRNMTESNQ